MKLFKSIVMLILVLITAWTGYFALLYEVEIANGTFLISSGITLLVASDDGLQKN